MALSKTPSTLISNQTVTAGNSVSAASSLDLSAAIDFSIGFSLTFGAATTGAARIELYGDPTGANSAFAIGSYDNPVDSYDIPLSASHTVSGVIPFNRSAKYVKARLVNTSNQSITGAYLYGIVQGQ